ncbi:AEC family transporter [Nitratireductor sp. XY-223]|uniref:AEC family transporter n=1 Tax=Nitratireductor sp. XY-223 TaxID=2561926 RepID=UPI0010AB1EFD|nr:AEC family transporter [Nitratireductor sp. XY-223]
MTLTEKTLEHFFVLIFLAGLAIFLRNRNVIRQQEQGVFARLVTDFALPALIFGSLSVEPFTLDGLLPALSILTSISVVMLVAWVLGRLLKLGKPVLGSVVLVAGVGSSSTLGYAIIQNVYSNDPQVMRKVVTMGEFGVVLPLFTFGVMLAMFFGRDAENNHSFGAAFVRFLRTPVFAATVLGVLFSYIELDRDNWIVNSLYELIGAIGASMTVLVAFAVGLMLRPIEFRKLAPLILLVAGLKLVLEPLLALAAGQAFALDPIERELLIIEAAMPSGTLAAIIAARYGCDSVVASSLVVATYVLSLVALPLVFAFSL